MVKLDKIDKTILSLLEKDSRTSYYKIAKELDVTEGTIRHRIKRLKNNNLLKNFTVDYKGKYIGVALIELLPDKDKKEVLKKLNSYGIKAYSTSGRYDVTCMLQKDIEKSVNRISLIKEIANIDFLKINE